jgi:predicted NBD/HSP70 family sugar kinase
VIGGGLSRAAEFFMERAEREARSRALPALEAQVGISLARAGADAGVVGAGLLAFQEVSAGNGDTAGATATEGIR